MLERLSKKSEHKDHFRGWYGFAAIVCRCFSLRSLLHGVADGEGAISTKSLGVAPSERRRVKPRLGPPPAALGRTLRLGLLIAIVLALSGPAKAGAASVHQKTLGEWSCTSLGLPGKLVPQFFVYQTDDSMRWRITARDGRIINETYTYKLVDTRLTLRSTAVPFALLYRLSFAGDDVLSMHSLTRDSSSMNCRRVRQKRYSNLPALSDDYAAAEASARRTRRSSIGSWITTPNSATASEMTHIRL